jgi:hypothetical protein
VIPKGAAAVGRLKHTGAVAFSIVDGHDQAGALKLAVV